MDAARQQQARMVFPASRLSPAARSRAMSPEMADRKQQLSTAFEEERNRAMQQQGQEVVPEMTAPAPQTAMNPVRVGTPRIGTPISGLSSGINFGPGRANRVPDQGTPEYEQLLGRVRGLGQRRR
jgi:hypothetical protein